MVIIREDDIDKPWKKKGKKKRFTDDIKMAQPSPPDGARKTHIGEIKKRKKEDSIISVFDKPQTCNSCFPFFSTRLKTCAVVARYRGNVTVLFFFSKKETA